MNDDSIDVKAQYTTDSIEDLHELLQRAEQYHGEWGQPTIAMEMADAADFVASELVEDDPDLLDSVDYSTPMQGQINGVDAGDERMTVSAVYSAARLVEDLRRFSPHLSEPPSVPKTEQQPLVTDGGHDIPGDAVVQEVQE